MHGTKWSEYRWSQEQASLHHYQMGMLILTLIIWIARCIGPLVFSDIEPAYICKGLAKAARGCGYSEG